MNVDDLDVASPRTGSNLSKDKFLRTGNFQQREILGRRSDENQIIVLRVVQGKQAAALDPNGLVKFYKNPIQRVYRQNLSHAGVMVKNVRLPVARRFVVRSEERRVGKECRYRWSPYQEKKHKVQDDEEENSI